MTQRRLLLAVWLLAVGAGAALAALDAATRLRADPLLEACVASLGLETFVALAALAGGLVSRRRLGARLGLGLGRLSGARLALVVAGTLALSHALDSLLALSGLREGSALERFELAFASARGTRLALALLAVGLAPGIAEELLCRGLVQRGLEPRLGTAPAVVLAALVFGALHLDPVHAASAAVLGLYLGWVAALAGSIRASILCHAANNAVAVLTVALLPGLEPSGAGGALLALLAAAGCGAAASRGSGGPGGRAGPTLQEKAGSDDR